LTLDLKVKEIIYTEMKEVKEILIEHKIVIMKGISEIAIAKVIDGAIKHTICQINSSEVKSVAVESNRLYVVTNEILVYNIKNVFKKNCICTLLCNCI